MRRPDACPGVLHPHQAADGAMVRLRVPGGRTTGTVLHRLRELANSYGNGILQLTSRAGLQLRGLPDPLPPAFVTAIDTTGLLPSSSHERVRNIVASPLTGIVGGMADVGELINALDAGLIEQPALADLPGRFLFVLDDGRGDVLGLAFDLGYQARSPQGGFVLVGSPTRGIAVTTAEVVPTLIRLALDFSVARTGNGAWHVADLVGWADPLDLTEIDPLRGLPAIRLGRIGDAASVAVPLARLTQAQAELVTALVGEDPVVITPWRGLVIPGAADRLAELRAAGFVVDTDSAWSGLSACVGAPFCGRAQIDTTAIADLLAHSAVFAADGCSTPVHVSGCDRRCGAPAGDHLDLVAPSPEEALASVGAGVLSRMSRR